MLRSSPTHAPFPALLIALSLLLGASTTAIAQQPATGADGREAEQRPSTQGAAPVTAQKAQQADDITSLLARGGAFTASVEMVRVPVIVVDDDGAFVTDLAAGDFAVRDGRHDHPVDHFVSDAEPVVVGILVDASAEMRPWGDDARVAVEHIAANLRPDDELFLLAYGAEVAVLHEPTRDKSGIAAAMGGYATQDGDGRALYDAIEEGLSTLSRSPIDKRSLIIIGGGGDTASDMGELAVRELISRSGVTIHAIAMATRRTSPRRAPGASARMVAARRVGRLRTLPEIASYTAGLIARRPRLAATYRSVADWPAAAGTDVSAYLKHQYLLHYAPQNPPRPGTWRAIRVEVAGKHREIRARSGYTR